MVRPGSSASHHLPIEPHHSLHHPFDISMPYWRYGGSTVCTESLIRLTPTAQSRQGWLFNEFELQSRDWEIELHFEVKSEFHIGGDGMGIFILNETFHPRRNKGHNYLSGSVFGMIERFQGFGVILDTYDNDGKRDNPSVFSIKQERDKMQQVFSNISLHSINELLTTINSGIMTMILRIIWCKIKWTKILTLCAQTTIEIRMSTRLFCVMSIRNCMCMSNRHQQMIMNTVCLSKWALIQRDITLH